MTHGKAGKVTLELTINQISDSNQVEVAHKISFKAPTETGDKTKMQVVKPYACSPRRQVVFNA